MVDIHSFLSFLAHSGILIGGGILIWKGFEVVHHELVRGKPPRTFATPPDAGGQSLPIGDPAGHQAPVSGVTVPILMQGTLILIAGIIVLFTSTFPRFTPEVGSQGAGVDVQNRSKATIFASNPNMITRQDLYVHLDPQVAWSVPVTPPGPGGAPLLGPMRKGSSVSPVFGSPASAARTSLVNSFSADRVELFEGFFAHMRDNEEAILDGKTAEAENRKAIRKLAIAHLLRVASIGASDRMVDPDEFEKALDLVDRAGKEGKTALWDLMLAHAKLIAETYDRKIAALAQAEDKEGKLPVYQSIKAYMYDLVEVGFDKLTQKNVYHDRLNAAQALVVALSADKKTGVPSPAEKRATP
jgi:hypothetical protein